MSSTFRALVVMWLLTTGCVMGLADKQEHLYVQLYKGKMISGTYDAKFSLDRLTRCALKCASTYQCWAFTWDTSTKECSLLQPSLTRLVTTAAAPLSLSTYYVGRRNGKSIKLTNSVGSWMQQKTACENMGGRLWLPPDMTFALVLLHVFGVDGAWLGMKRPSTGDMHTWYDLDGNLVHIGFPWGEGQPNNLGGDQFYLGLINGALNDAEETYILYGLCEV